MNQADTPLAAIRLAGWKRDANPHHHLFNNNGTWWCQFTVHRADQTAERVRVSLRTRDAAEACRKRDRLFARLEGRAAA